ncbi:hypothetical protein TGVEG_440530 [Toxoplasma gondii VEG]|uniref:Transmembrane protein n=1 Tax=Toxoplasma gondii (strain ATCC 50861 / VEG) TaxID=432359 RepID=V4ZKW4_TOXGV|nr:hypothetical protein TGVEG_440530 [Toxoplasma gondii VEG]
MSCLAIRCLPFSFFIVSAVSAVFSLPDLRVCREASGPGERCVVCLCIRGCATPHGEAEGVVEGFDVDASVSFSLVDFPKLAFRRHTHAMLALCAPEAAGPPSGLRLGLCGPRGAFGCPPVKFFFFGDPGGSPPSRREQRRIQKEALTAVVAGVVRREAQAVAPRNLLAGEAAAVVGCAAHRLQHRLAEAPADALVLFGELEQRSAELLSRGPVFLQGMHREAANEHAQKEREGEL